MRIYGLTGGIASGKSTVSAMFRELGAPVIDADQVARDVVEPGEPALQEIAKRFDGVINADGTLNRARLGEKIFSNAADREALNAIIHPRIQEAVAIRTMELADQGVPVALYDAALLIENRLHALFNGVILVEIPREMQLERLMRRDGLARAQAEARLNSQMSLEEKRPFANWVIDNSKDLSSTREQVNAIWQSLQTES